MMDGTIARLRYELGREPEEKEIAGALNVLGDRIRSHPGFS